MAETILHYCNTCFKKIDEGIELSELVQKALQRYFDDIKVAQDAILKAAEQGGTE